MAEVKPGVTDSAPPAPELTPEDIVTPDILEAIMKNINKPDLELINFDAHPATKAGDNYMSLIWAAKLNLKNKKTGEKEVLPVMLKVLPRNEVRIKMIQEGNIFVRDINMYDKVMPAMERFQREVVGLSEAELFTPWPKCYACKTDGKGDFLAMEDLKIQGFKMGNRQIGLDFDHCQVVLKAMAKFHAISYGMFQGDFDKILESYPWLEEVMFHGEKQPPVFKEMFKNMFIQQADMLRKNNEEKAAAMVDTMYKPNFYETMHKLCGGKVNWAIVGHGDLWTNNMLFRYNEDNKPIEVKFVDYQISRAASRTLDMHYFLFSSPQLGVLNQRSQELLDIYYEEFTKFAKKLGVDIEEHHLTKENFNKEFEAHRYFGVVMGMMLAMFTTADSADVPEMESMTEDDWTSSESNFILGMVKDKALVRIKDIANNHLPKCAEMQEHL